MGLVPTNADTNILKDFPLVVKRVVVSSVVKYFDSQQDEANKTLTTSTHVRFIMELIGQSFQLPIEEHEVINQAINIYERWIFVPEKRPKPFQEQAQHFLREIFKHFSFLFEVRPNQTATVLKDHIYLCNRVMDLFLNLGTQDVLDEESWHHVLKIILGITDSTLRGTRGIPELYYGLLKVLFELWLCSLSQDRQMWDHLQLYATQWTKHMATIKQWNSVCFALTQRVINLLYGPVEGYKIVRIEWQGLNKTNNPSQNVSNPITEMDLPDEYVYFAWRMFLNIIGNPNNILDPEIHLKAFYGLKSISDCVALIGNDPSVDALKDLRIPYAPDGNTLVSYFGAWLFEAVNKTANMYAEGRAVAYSALCNIYCRKGGKPWTAENLSLFYHALILGLDEQNSPIVVNSILRDSAKIFCYELEGSHILIPSYMKICERILCSDIKFRTERDLSDQIRNSAITIVASLLCVPNFFKGKADTSIAGAALYSDLRCQIERVLAAALIYETYPKNLQLILWCMYVYLYEETRYSPTIGPTFIGKILELIKKYGTKPTREYSIEVFITIYEVLSGLTCIFADLTRSDTTVASNVVEQISLTIPILVNALKTTNTYIPLVVEAFYCMCDWIMVGYETVLNDSGLIGNIVAAIEIGLSVDKLTKRPEEEVEPIKVAAEFVLSHMLHTVGHYPPTSESSQFSSSISEKWEALDNETGDTSNYVRYFIFDNLFIFAVIDQPEEKNGPGMTIITRDITGRYAWDSRIIYPKHTEPIAKLETQGTYTSSVASDVLFKSPELETNSLMMKFSTIPTLQDRPGVSAFEKLIDDEEDKEAAVISSKADSIKSMDISQKPPISPAKYKEDCKFQLARLFLSHIGLFYVDVLAEGNESSASARFVQLQSNQKVIRSLKSLDETPERDYHKIGVVYVKEDQDLQNEILENEGGSDRYKKFLETLGWYVDLKKHSGFMGGLDHRGSTGAVAPYFADYKTEVMFHVASLMPNNPKDPQQIHKKRHIGNDHTNIVWTEHTRNYYRNTIVSQFNFVHLVIYPLKNGMLRLDTLIKEKEKTPVFGPILDGMVLNERILGILLRQTAINGNRAVRKFTTGYIRPSLARRKTILEIAERYKTAHATQDFFALLFMTKDSSNVAHERAKLGRGTSIAVQPKEEPKDMQKKKSGISIFKKK